MTIKSVEELVESLEQANEGETFTYKGIKFRRASLLYTKNEKKCKCFQIHMEGMLWYATIHCSPRFLARGVYHCHTSDKPANLKDRIELVLALGKEIPKLERHSCIHLFPEGKIKT